MKEILKSNWTAFFLALVIMFLLFAVAPANSVSNAIGGVGLVLWIGYWAFRNYLK